MWIAVIPLGANIYGLRVAVKRHLRRTGQAERIEEFMVLARRLRKWDSVLRLAVKFATGL